MFTGIITDVGRIRSIEDGGMRRIVLETGLETDNLDIGASVACSGVCLTAVERGSGWFAVEASNETLAATTIGDWMEGTRVNLERALRMGDELGGHLLSGHVDGLGRIVGRVADGESVRFSIALPPGLMPFVAPKGSIALDGVSLTVNDVDEDRFGVNIIPHTLEATTFGALDSGDRVNVEVDMLARYVARQLALEGGRR